MCTLIALHRTVPGYDLVVGMNRDEDRARPATPPDRIPGPPAIVAPRDARAGGTWIGMNESGLLVALSNRRGRTSAAAKSRGLLVLEALKLANPRAVEIAVGREVAQNDYNFFNLIAATRDELRFLTYDGQVRMTRGHEGVNVLTNAGGNPDGDPKVATVRSLVGAGKFADGTTAVRFLETALRHHGGGGSTPLCVHGPGGGTVSSTILAVHNTVRGENVLLYAEGSPCEAPYRDYSGLARALKPDVR